ncbi:MAG: hypothetical protein ACREDR_11705 [Blastocatellia bacterium]
MKIALLLAMLLGHPSPKKSIPPVESMEVSFCNFELPREVRTANASFNVVYSFEVDSRGKPVKIRKVHNSYIENAAVVSCMSAWHLHLAKGGRLHLAVFHWQHGVGWDQLTVRGPHFSQKMRIIGNPCPYGNSK